MNKETNAGVQLRWVVPPPWLIPLCGGCISVLTVLRAFPCRTRLADRDSASAVEEEVTQSEPCVWSNSMYQVLQSAFTQVKHDYKKVVFLTLTLLQICQNLFMRGLSLVGWYHSHPRGPALPSLQDIDSQMDHQLRLQGSNNGFQPCLGIICGKCLSLYPYTHDQDILTHARNVIYLK